MNPGQPLTLASILPFGMSADDFYVFLVAIAAFLLVWSFGGLFADKDRRVRSRIKTMHERRETLKANYLAPVVETQETEKRKEAPGWMQRTVDKLANLKGSQQEVLNKRLIRAGYHDKSAATVFMFVKIVAPLVGLALALMLVKIDWGAPFELKQLGKWFVVVLAGYAGVALPDLLLYNARQKRYDNIRLALPDTLDLMLICAEAGLSLSASLDRVTRELGKAYPEMADELGYTSVEISFLPDRNTALRHLADRVDMQEVRGITNILQQTEKYGTPIGQALRVLSKEFRTERMLRAEQKAARLPAIMTIPLITFILPTLFIIILAPAIIQVMNT